MIRALLFDFDGLILETESPIYHSWCELYEQFGQELSKLEWDKTIGTSAAEHFDPFDQLEMMIGKSLPRKALMAQRRDREMELLYEEVTRPGVENWIGQAIDLGLRLGIASSSSAKWVRGHLTRLGLIDYFEVIHTADDVVNTKPDPALYELALASLSVAADDAIVLEDSPNGVTAAQRAGIFTIVVPNPMTEDLPLDHANMRLSSLEEIDLRFVIQLVES